MVWVSVADLLGVLNFFIRGILSAHRDHVLQSKWLCSSLQAFSQIPVSSIHLITALPVEAKPVVSRLDSARVQPDLDFPPSSPFFLFSFPLYRRRRVALVRVSS